MTAASLETVEVDGANFRAALLGAKAYAVRGEFIEEEELGAQFEEMLRS